ncbi:MAG: hypothetical protein Q4F07_05610 [Bacteroidales bacterium]|nr:hypothetical protein [Bacteroidales bacterium]
MDKIVRRITRITVLLVTVAAIMGCQRTSLIGELAGQWQIMEITYPDGLKIKVPQKYPQRYYCFYRHTAELTYAGYEKTSKNMAVMHYDKPSLSLEFVYGLPDGYESWGIVLPEGQKPVAGTTINYHIEHQTRENLVLVTDVGTHIILRKF